MPCISAPGKNLRRKDLLCIFSPWRVGRKWNLVSEGAPATTGKEGKWNSCTFEEEKIQPVHIEWLFANSGLKVQKKVCAHLWWLHTKASLFHLWHRCVWTQPCVRQWVRCDVVGTVVPVLVQIIHCMYLLHPNPPLPVSTSQNNQNMGDRSETDPMFCLPTQGSL